MQQLGIQCNMRGHLIVFLYKKKMVKCISSCITNAPPRFSNVAKLVPWFLKVTINGTLVLVHLP